MKNLHDNKIRCEKRSFVETLKMAPVNDSVQEQSVIPRELRAKEGKPEVVSRHWRNVIFRSTIHGGPPRLVSICRFVTSPEIYTTRQDCYADRPDALFLPHLPPPRSIQVSCLSSGGQVLSLFTHSSLSSSAFCYPSIYLAHSSILLSREIAHFCAMSFATLNRTMMPMQNYICIQIAYHFIGRIIYFFKNYLFNQNRISMFSWLQYFILKYTSRALDETFGASVNNISVCSCRLNKVTVPLGNGASSRVCFKSNTIHKIRFKKVNNKTLKKSKCSEIKTPWNKFQKTF